MQLILLTSGGNRRWNFGARAVRLGLVSVAALVAVAYAIGFNAGIEGAPLARSDEKFEKDAALLAQQQEINTAISYTARELMSLVARAGSLAGEVENMRLRLKAVAEAAGIDPNVYALDSGLVTAAKGGSVAPIDQKLRELAQRLDRLTPVVGDLEAATVIQRVNQRTLPAGRPVRQGWISSSFGVRTDPVTGRRAFHAGMDLAGRYKTPIIAVADGIVTVSEFRSSYGNMVEIAHRHGLATRYAHNAKNLVAEGDTVARGDVIALMGSTGRSTGTHVHFEILRDGEAVNPAPFVRSKP